MNWTVKSAALALFTSVSIGCATPTATPPSVQSFTDTCAVLRDVPAFVGRDIKLRGILRTDFEHYSGITDAGCLSSWMSFGPDHGALSPGDRELWDATQRAYLSGETVHLVAEGRIERQREDPNMGSYVLMVSRFSEITVSAGQ